MTTDEFIAKQKERLRKLQTENKPFAIAVLITHGDVNNRIFIQGKKASGAAIGQYSTKPFYMNPNRPDIPVKFGVKGKFGDTKFKSGRSHKTRYFGGGYKEFRAVSGRQNAFIDLGLTFDLKFDHSRPPRRITANKYTAGVVRTNNGDKIRGIERRKGIIFTALTKEEKVLLVKITTDERVKMGI